MWRCRQIIIETESPRYPKSGYLHRALWVMCKGHLSQPRAWEASQKWANLIKVSSFNRKLWVLSGTQLSLVGLGNSTSELSLLVLWSSFSCFWVWGTRGGGFMDLTLSWWPLLLLRVTYCSNDDIINYADSYLMPTSLPLQWELHGGRGCTCPGHSRISTAQHSEWPSQVLGQTVWDPNDEGLISQFLEDLLGYRRTLPPW